jgi:hypothetical protein
MLENAAIRLKELAWGWLRSNRGEAWLRRMSLKRNRLPRRPE